LGLEVGQGYLPAYR